MANNQTVNFGKVVRLLGKPLEDNFEVVYGLDRPYYQLDFALIYMDTRYWGNAYFKTEPKILKMADHRKKIHLFGYKPKKEDVEDALLVIIPYANQIVTTAEKIAGRFSTEAVLIMHDGDIIEVSKSNVGERIVYMAVQAGNEMFLIKKSR